MLRHNYSMSAKLATVGPLAESTSTVGDIYKSTDYTQHSARRVGGYTIGALRERASRSEKALRVIGLVLNSNARRAAPPAPRYRQKLI